MRNPPFRQVGLDLCPLSSYNLLMRQALSCLNTLILVCLFSGPLAYAQTVSSETYGFTKLAIAAGTGTTKRTSLIAIPLLGETALNGASHGRITSTGATTLTSLGAQWVPGELSQPSKPHLVEITSGHAEGRLLLISTTTPNTVDTVTIDQNELIRSGDINAMNITAGIELGDTFRIRPADTLRSFFGTPEETLIIGGNSPTTADTVTLVNNGSSSSYFFNTSSSPPQWTRVSLGSAPSNEVPLPPYAGIQYSRLGNTPIELLVTGTVPTGTRKVALKDSGTSLISAYWLQPQSLQSLALQDTSTWLAGPNARVADTVVGTTDGSVQSYFFDGTNWRRVSLGNPLSNHVEFSPHSGLLINKKGTSANYSIYQHNAPYQSTK